MKHKHQQETRATTGNASSLAEVFSEAARLLRAARAHSRKAFKAASGPEETSFALGYQTLVDQVATSFDDFVQHREIVPAGIYDQAVRARRTIVHRKGPEGKTLTVKLLPDDLDVAGTVMNDFLDHSVESYLSSGAFDKVAEGLPQKMLKAIEPLSFQFGMEDAVTDVLELLALKPAPKPE